MLIVQSTSETERKLFQEWERIWKYSGNIMFITNSR